MVGVQCKWLTNTVSCIMRVAYCNCRTDTKVLELVAYDDAAATAEWKLADVRQNRSGICQG